MSYKWDDKLTERFLTLYRKHQCLWNPYSLDYKNCSVKNEAFRTVIEELNIPKIRISECLQQIEIIREKYKQEQLKAEKKLASGQLYTSKLPWFNLMSQMLCQVINDEENFREVPLRHTPCTVTKGLQNKDPRTAFTRQESSNLPYKPEKYVQSKSKQSNNLDNDITSEEMGYGLKKTNYENNNLQYKSKIVNDINELWNICPSCGWETENNPEKTYNGANQFNNYKESAARISPVTEVPLQIKPTQILKTTNNPCSQVDEVSHSNWRIKTPESDIIQNRKKAQTNAGSENSKGKLCVPVEPKEWDPIGDKIFHQDDSKTKDSRDVISSKENNVYYPRSENEFVKNVIMCPSHVRDIHESRFLENQQRNFEINKTSHLDSRPNLVLYQDSYARRTQKTSEFEKEIDSDKMSNNCDRYNSCIQKFGVRSNQLTTSDDDKYELCSRFKIIIPTSDQEDRSLEITGYEVRVLNPQLSRYMLCPSSEVSKVAIDNVECACKNEFSTPMKNVNEDTARCSNVIKLAINHKRSKEPRAKKQSHTSAATCTRQGTCLENDQDSEIDQQHKSLSNKKTQTDRSFETKSIQTSKNMERSKFDHSKSVRDQGCAIDVSSMNGKSCCVTTSDRNSNLIEQEHPSMLNDNLIINENTSMPPQAENNSLQVDKFTNTRIFLNVIVKILESDSTNNISEYLQTTLNTMLDRFEQMPNNGQSAVEQHTNNNTQGAIFNDSTMSTQYQSFALNPVPAKRQAKDIHPQRTNNATVDLGDTATGCRAQTVDLEDTGSSRRPQSLNLEETNKTANKQAGESIRKSWSLNETNKSNDERVARSYERPASLLENTSTSVHSALNYTNEFLEGEPTASSSKRFQENRSPNQLTKDFLHVIRYTMMMDAMDEVSPSTKNGNMDCCNQTKRSTNP